MIWRHGFCRHQVREPSGKIMKLGTGDGDIRTNKYLDPKVEPIPDPVSLIGSYVNATADVLL